MNAAIRDSNVKEEEVIYRWPVALYFGGPWTDQQQSLLDQRAIEWNCSFELASVHYFKWLIKGYCEITNGEGKNYFDLSVFLGSGIKDVYSPKIIVDTYKLNGFSYPKVIFEDGFISDKSKVKRFFLKDEVIRYIGHSLEELTEYEYIDFKRVNHV
jgi:hypothetical protein